MNLDLAYIPIASTLMLVNLLTCEIPLVCLRSSFRSFYLARHGKPACHTSPITVTSKISVIIPAFNEGRNIEATLKAIDAGVNDPQTIEVIISDAGSSDDTRKIVNALATSLRIVIRLVSSSPGRAAACNAGAAQALGEIVYFVHADTIVPRGFDSLIREALVQDSCAAGAFSFKVNPLSLLDSPRSLWGLRSIERSANQRSRVLEFPFGDQTLFLRTSTFREVGCFPAYSMMEDYAFIYMLRAHAARRGQRILTLPACAQCDGRRWKQKGVFRNTVMNQLFIVAFNLFGLSPSTIYKIYYRS